MSLGQGEEAAFEELTARCQAIVATEGALQIASLAPVTRLTYYALKQHGVLTRIFFAHQRWFAPVRSAHRMERSFDSVVHPWSSSIHFLFRLR